jgi:diguanylate cyclase (GGDEF)-like protein
MSKPSAPPASRFSRDMPRDDPDRVGRGAALTDVLARVSREALQGENFDAILHRIVDCLVERLPVAIASIILLDAQRTTFIQEVWAGELDLQPPAIATNWPVTMGAAGRCARTGQAQLITQVDEDPDYVPGNSLVRSEYLVPIRHRDRLHGVLNIESTQQDFFTEQACAVFDAIADQIAGLIHLARVAGELEAANRKLEQLSMQDGLTGIANRRCFDQRLAQEWQRRLRAPQPLALLLIDADCFKALNDVLGHLHGDECLRELARLCSGFAREPDDLLARFGGEELVLLLPGRGFLEACELAERLRRRIEEAALNHPASSVAPVVTVSVGVSSTRPTPARPPECLIVAADRALYEAKALGRNRVKGRPVDALAPPWRPRDRLRGAES